MPSDGKIGACSPVILLLERGVSQIMTVYVLTKENGHGCDCFLDQSLFYGSCRVGHVCV